MAERHSETAFAARVRLRLVDARAGLLMSLAEWTGRLSESLESLSRAAHRRSMRDYCTTMLDPDDLLGADGDEQQVSP
jgi:hypothetical protein